LATPLAELAQFDDADPGVVLAGAEGTNGEWARFERTIHSSPDTADTGLEDERCGVDLTMEQDHPEQEEPIDVVAGERRVAFWVRCGQSPKARRVPFHRGTLIDTGTPVTVPPEWELRPGLRTEECAEGIYRLARAG